MKKPVFCALAVVMAASVCVAAAGCGGKGAEVEIVVDGGGQNAHFNSTKSMIYDKYANPYPYNTLEKIGEEWSKAHPGYKIKIASSSLNNDNETMRPALNQGTAPEILFYLGTTIAEDMSKGWFVDLNEYMEKPNKYSAEGEAGSVHWKDIYSAEEYSTTLAPNGMKYTAEMEKNPIGFIYNKTVFKAAGITETPETFADFMEAQDKVYEYALSQGKGDSTADNYLCPYFPYYPWYDSVIESSLYGEYLEYYDVIKKDGVLDAQETARAYMTKDSKGTRLYSPDDARAKEKARLTTVMTKYYPVNFESYYAEQQFVGGNLAMLEVLGGSIRKIVDSVDGKFEIGVFPYPVLTQKPADAENGDYYTTYNVDRHVRRGLSGYSTGWAVTNSAVAKGQDVVDMCVDFLMYVTSYSVNDRMINDKGFSIPLSGNPEYEYFKTLAAEYEADSADKTTLAWAAVCPGGALNKTYYDANYLTRMEIIKAKGNQETIDLKLAGLLSSFTTAVNNVYKQNSWNRDEWPAYTGPDIT